MLIVSEDNFRACMSRLQVLEAEAEIAALPPDDAIELAELESAIDDYISTLESDEETDVFSVADLMREDVDLYPEDEDELDD